MASVTDGSHMKSSLEALERMVAQQSETIDTLTEQIKQLRNEKLNLENALRDERKKGAAPPTAGKPPIKKKSSTGVAGGGGVSAGASQADAKASLGALFAKKPPPASSESKSEEKSSSSAEDPYARVFKKYEMIMKMTQSVWSAIGRMTQDGIDKDIIAQFKLKHADKIGDTDGGGDDDVSAVSLGLKEKRKIKRATKLKLKRIHWTPVPMRDIPNTIWKDIDDSMVKYQPQRLELNFQVRQRKPKPKSGAGGHGGRSGAPGSGSGSPEQIDFVSKKRSQQVQIGLKGLGYPRTRFDELRRQLLAMDEKSLDADRVSTLLDLIPTTEEQTKAEKASATLPSSLSSEAIHSRFGIVESFFYTFCDFYQLNQRMRMWLFKMQFAEIKSTLDQQFQCVQKACDKISRSKSLLKFLEVILAFGNHLNHGTKKGGAYGFDLKVLVQLSELKTMDNSKSFLTYVYEYCDRNKNYHNVLNISEDLGKLLKNASHIETEVTANAFERMEESFKEIGDLISPDNLENIEEQYDPHDHFIAVMTAFHNREAKQLKKFKFKVNAITARAKSVMKKFYFGESNSTSGGSGGGGSSDKIETMFRLLSEIIIQFDNSKHILIKLEKEREKKRRIAEKKRQKAIKSGEVPAKKTVPSEPRLGMSALQAAVAKKLAFEESLNTQKASLKAHVRAKSIVAKRGGIRAVPTSGSDMDAKMRRVSSIVQTSMADIEEARKKAALKRIQQDGSATRLPKFSRKGRAGLRPIPAKDLTIAEDEEQEYGIKAPPRKGRQSTKYTEALPISPPPPPVISKSSSTRSEDSGVEIASGRRIGKINVDSAGTKSKALPPVPDAAKRSSKKKRRTVL